MGLVKDWFDRNKILVNEGTEISMKDFGVEIVEELKFLAHV